MLARQPLYICALGYVDKNGKVNSPYLKFVMVYASDISQLTAKHNVSKSKVEPIVITVLHAWQAYTGDFSEQFHEQYESSQWIDDSDGSELSRLKQKMAKDELTPFTQKERDTLISDAIDAQIRSYADRLASLEIAEIVRLDKSTIKRRAKALGVKFYKGSDLSYQPEEDDFIKANYEDMTYGDIGIIIKRHPDSVGMRARALGLSKKCPAPQSYALAWSAHESAKLMYMRYQGYDNHQIAIELGRTYEATRYRVKYLNKVFSTKTKSSQFVYEFLLRLRQLGMPYKDIAPIMNRSEYSVRTLHSRLKEIVKTTPLDQPRQPMDCAE